MLARSSSASLTKLNRAFATRSGTIRNRFREPENGKPRVVMAYSGGLDTSCQLAWLTKARLRFLWGLVKSDKIAP